MKRLCLLILIFMGVNCYAVTVDLDQSFGTLIFYTDFDSEGNVSTGTYSFTLDLNYDIKKGTTTLRTIRREKTLEGIFTPAIVDKINNFIKSKWNSLKE